MTNLPPKPFQIRISKFDLLDLSDPDQAMLDVRDMARVLSRIPRFNGHGVNRISVAEHSVNVASTVKYYLNTNRAHEFSNRFKRDLELAGLFHDGHEYLVGDISTPFKRLIGHERLRQLAIPMDDAIAEMIDISPTLFHHQYVKDADRSMLDIECGYIFEMDTYADCVNDLRLLAAMRPHSPKGFFNRSYKVGLPAEQAEKLFLDHFSYLTGF